ncbi:MAG: hypothetical protein ACRDHK_13930 [Actinomycetota bacterium]
MEAVGIGPRSTLMKATFVVLGVAWLAVTMAFALKLRWAWTAMMIFAVGTLWYLVVGTFTSVVIIALLLLPSARSEYLG